MSKSKPLDPPPNCKVGLGWLIPIIDGSKDFEIVEGMREFNRIFCPNRRKLLLNKKVCGRGVSE